MFVYCLGMATSHDPCNEALFNIRSHFIFYADQLLASILQGCNIQENEAKIPQTSSILTHIFIMEIGRLFYISEQFSNMFIIYLIRIQFEEIHSNQVKLLPIYHHIMYNKTFTLIIKNNTNQAKKWRGFEIIRNHKLLGIDIRIYISVYFLFIYK